MQLIQFTVIIDYFCLVRRVPPHFTIQPDAKYEVNKNADLNITCVAVGSPMPFVKWREGVTDITPENDVPIGKNPFLNDKKKTLTKWGSNPLFTLLKNWLLASFFNFLITVFLQLDGVNLSYFKLWLFDQTEFLVWDTTTSGCKDIRIRKLELEESNQSVSYWLGLKTIIITFSMDLCDWAFIDENLSCLGFHWRIVDLLIKYIVH